MGDESYAMYRDSRTAALFRAGAADRREQAAQLERVSDRIAGAILGFCRERVGRTFHADELRKHVETVCGSTAPGSADRILRDLRAKGRVRYSVLSRKASLYHVTGVA